MLPGDRTGVANIGDLFRNFDEDFCPVKGADGIALAPRASIHVQSHAGLANATLSIDCRRPLVSSPVGLAQYVTQHFC